MTLNKGDKLRNMDKRRGSMPFPLHLQNLHRRSMPVDDRELRSMPENQPSLRRFSPADEHGNSCVSDSSDSVISSGSDSDGQIYKVVLLGEHGVGKSSLARIFGGVEDSNDCEETGKCLDVVLVHSEVLEFRFSLLIISGKSKWFGAFLLFTSLCNITDRYLCILHLYFRKHIWQIPCGWWWGDVNPSLWHMGTGKQWALRVIFILNKLNEIQY